MSHAFTFIRHGESTANQREILQGQSDFPLSERGKGQAVRLASFWQEQGVTFDKVITSSLLRAQETAEILRRTLHLPLETSDLWMELNYGTAQGSSRSEVKDQLKGLQPPSPYQPLFHSGESPWEINMRAQAAILDLVLRPAGSYLVVTHGGFLKTTLYVMLGIQGFSRNPDFHFENTGVTRTLFESKTGKWTIVTLNDTRHFKHGRGAK